MSDRTLTAWAELLIDALVQSGVRTVVVSPGSRSTPLVAAAFAHPSLTCHDAIDERAAAFFALGAARVTGRPALLLCTSGTAGAHYYPAVIEASAAHVPLLVLTADRPWELMDCAAPQTIDQTRLYGTHVRRFVELGLPDDDDGARRALARTVAQAVHATRWPLPGAVHINARARKPLEPIAGDPPHAPSIVVGVPRLLPDPAAIATLADACVRARRGVIVCGPAPASQAAAAAAVDRLAAASGFPLLAERTSQLTGLATFDLALRTPRFCDEQADLILQLGAPPTSSMWERAYPDAARAVIAPHGWPDPTSRASWMIQADVADAADALAQAILARRAHVEPSAWRMHFVAADHAVRRAVDDELTRDDALAEGHIARDTFASVPRGGWLMVGNSLPIRHLDTYALARDDVRVLSQRGVNGIDGLVAGAAGAAIAAGAPLTLLVGDVSFLHDLGGLALAARVPTPLPIVVIHNDGGRIFEQLPIARAASPALMSHFTTPHGAGLVHAARLYGVRHARVTDRPGLRAALDEAQRTAGATVIEAIVAPHGAAEAHERIVRAVGEALA
jgi:2-succinyl-5-enolpyruvyl-6-hydroxy-3-cyclohexene-1-carboxylate synthase